MLVDFRKIKFDHYGNVEEPNLILKTLHNETIGYLGDYFNLTLTLRYNGFSEMSFVIPKFCIKDGFKVNTPHYNRVTGMKLIHVDPFGVFLLMAPTVSSDGVREIKTCKAYSLDYEMNNKKIFIADGTYNFYNPASPEDTIIGIIKEVLPNWKVGQVSPKLLGKYRTFEKTDDNLYSFIMNSLQSTYSCLFLFDTFTRTINVKSTEDAIHTAPIYLSYDNLLKETEVTELTDEIVTVLNVYGADPVTIHSVNPMGTNKIYNLFYFIDNGDIPEDIAAKWKLWQENFNVKQQVYSNLITEYNVQLCNLTTEQSKLQRLKSELEVAKQAQSALIKSSANKDDQTLLISAKEEIEEIEEKISEQKDVIQVIEEELENLNNEKKAINEACAFSAFLTPSELALLDYYFKEESLVDSTFILSSVDVSSDSISRDLTDWNVIIDADIVEVPVDTSLEKRLFDFSGRNIILTHDQNKTTGEIINLTLEVKNNNEFLLSCFLNHIKDTSDDLTSEYPSGNLSLKGMLRDFYDDEKELSFHIVESVSFLQFGVTEYQQQIVEKELYNYAVNVLKKMAEPSYEFSVSGGNFIFSQEFLPFKNRLQLGDSVYLKVDDMREPIKPLLLELNLDFENKNNFTMAFSDKFKMSKEVNLVDLLGSAISTANSVDFNKYNYSEYKKSNIKDQVRLLRQSALDVAKNTILSSSGQSCTIDSSGLHLREWDEAIQDYLPEQIRMINNLIAFTDDGWESAHMALGTFQDLNMGVLTGIVAQNIVGTLLAGSNLTITNESPDGKPVRFLIDKTGVYLDNSRILTSYGNTQIAIDPAIGFTIGSNPLYSVDTQTNELILNKDNANLYADRDGNLILKGTVYAKNGSFTGEVNATTGIFKGTIQANKYLDSSGRDMFEDNKFKSDYLNLKGLTIIDEDTGLPSLSIDNKGNVNIASGTISWDEPVIEYQYSRNNASWHNECQSDDIYRRERVAGGDWGAGYQFKGTDANVPSYIKSNYIGATEIRSPTIKAGEFYGADYYSADGQTHMDLLDYSGSEDAGLELYAKSYLGGDDSDPIIASIKRSRFATRWSSFGNLFLVSNENKVYPNGVWDFSSANVTNLNVTARFG